jgi:hypothetical protein
VQVYPKIYTSDTTLGGDPLAKIAEGRPLE